MTTTARHPVEPPDGDELAKFLLARLAEDEAAVQGAQGDPETAWMGKEETSLGFTGYPGVDYTKIL